MAPEKETVTVNDAGHDYDVLNAETGSQNIKFIKKELVEGGEEGELTTVHDGTTTEAVLEVTKHRLETLYSRLPDEFTKSAIEHLAAALSALKDRNDDRNARGVRGTNKE